MLSAGGRKLGEEAVGWGMAVAGTADTSKRCRYVGERTVELAFTHIEHWCGVRGTLELLEEARSVAGE